MTPELADLAFSGLGRQQTSPLAKLAQERSGNGDAIGGLPGGVPFRNKLFPGEMNFFRNNPHVAGRAAEDNAVTLNPFSGLSGGALQAVARNEAVRVIMRIRGIRPSFDITPEQQQTFKGYSADTQDIRETIAARIFSGDPSAGQPTPEQMIFVNQLRKMFGQ